MPTIAQQLNQLETDKHNFVVKFNEKGVEASDDDTFTDLVTKFDEIQSGEDISEYFKETLTTYGSNTTTSAGNWVDIFKKIPKFSGSPTTLRKFFYQCSAEEIDVSGLDTSNVTDMNQMFYNCNKITKIDLSNFDTSNVTDSSSMLSECNNLKKVIINNQNVFPMTNTSMLNNTPISKKTGYVYVPDNLVESYKSATNWSTYASQIKGISELPEE